MSDQGALGTDLGRYFRLNDVPSYISRIGKARVQVTRLQSDRPCIGVTDVIPADGSYVIGIQIRRPFTSVIRKPFTCAIWLGDRFIPPRQLVNHSVCWVHRERDTRVDVQTPFDMLYFSIPHNG